MNYAILFHENLEDFEKRANHEAPAYWEAWSTYIAALMESGMVRGGEGLLPPTTATQVRVRDGKRLLHDGPYPETKEMLGGFFIIDAPDLDSALEWAARSPAAAYGSVEVRPVMPPRE